MSKKIYRHLVFKFSFYLWEINNNKIFNYTKIKHRLIFEMPWKLTAVKYKSAFLTRNGKKQQFLAVDEGIRRQKVKPIGNIK